MVHPEELDYAAMAKALAQQNGWTTNRFAECADVADDFLSRFDPDWPRCNARKLLLAKWKDDPSLFDFARNRMREAFSALESSEERPDSDAEAFHDPVKPYSMAVDASSISIKEDSESSPSGNGVVVRSRFIHVLSGICVLMAGIFIGTLVRILSRSRHK